MNIVDLAKEIEKAYKALKNSDFNRDYEKGDKSKAYCLRRIDLLRDELLEMKKNIKRG